MYHITRFESLTTIVLKTVKEKGNKTNHEIYLEDNRVFLHHMHAQRTTTTSNKHIHWFYVTRPFDKQFA